MTKEEIKQIQRQRKNRSPLEVMEYNKEKEKKTKPIKKQRSYI
jgi:hypothetical protein